MECIGIYGTFITASQTPMSMDSKYIFILIFHKRMFSLTNGGGLLIESPLENICEILAIFQDLIDYLFD